MSEEARIRDEAIRSYPPGKHLVARYISENGVLDLHVFNPVDLPETLTNKFGEKLWLYSVQPLEKYQEKAAHEVALRRQRNTFELARRSVHGVTKGG